MALVVLALSACGGPGGGERDPDQNPPVSSPTSSDAEPAKTSVCKDKKGDGGAVDLLSASIRTQDDHVLVSARLAAPIPHTGHVWVGFHMQSGPGDTSGFRQVAMRWVNGRAIQPYFFDDNFRRKDDLRLSASAVEVQGEKVTMTLPGSLVGHLGDSWVWGAFADWSGQADGKDDGCPRQGMRMQPF